MVTMQSPLEEEAPLSKLHCNNVTREEEDNIIIAKPNDIKNEQRKEEETEELAKMEEQEEQKGEDGKDIDRAKSPNSSAYYNTSTSTLALSSFDSENEKRIPVDPVSLTEVHIYAYLLNDEIFESIIKYFPCMNLVSPMNIYIKSLI
jgi:hypothetical protein